MPTPGTTWPARRLEAGASAPSPVAVPHARRVMGTSTRVGLSALPGGPMAPAHAPRWRAWHLETARAKPSARRLGKDATLPFGAIEMGRRSFYSRQLLDVPPARSDAQAVLAELALYHL